MLVVETSEHYRRGNNTSMSTAMIPGAGSRWQRAEGIEDSPEQFVADIMAKTHGQADARLAQALAQVSAELVEWLADEVETPLSLATDFHYPGHAVDRCHTVEGRHGSVLLDHLVAQVRRSDRIDMLVPARLVDVLLDDAGGVRAVVVEQPDGQREEIATDAVLLATNGYGADRDMVQQHLPEIAAAVYHGSEASRGDALRIGTRLGGRAAYLDAYQGHAALAARAKTLVGWATVMRGGVLLDLTGRRFGDETGATRSTPRSWPRVPTPPGGWSSTGASTTPAWRSPTSGRPWSRAPWRGPTTPNSSARTPGYRTTTSTAELAQTAEVARGRAADRFGRTHFEAPLEPPYAAVRVVPALFHTQGGLVVDEHARVERADDAPIPGLYASGGAACGISGHGAAGYLAGNGLLPAFGLAYLAAGHAARHRVGHDRSVTGGPGDTRTAAAGRNEAR